MSHVASQGDDRAAEPVGSRISRGTFEQSLHLCIRYKAQVKQPPPYAAIGHQHLYLRPGTNGHRVERGQVGYAAAFLHRYQLPSAAKAESRYPYTLCEPDKRGSPDHKRSLPVRQGLATAFPGRGDRRGRALPSPRGLLKTTLRAVDFTRFRNYNINGHTILPIHPHGEVFRWNARR
jgi:hypothetical protein